MSKATILFAEDGPATRITVGDWLKSEGYDVIEARTGVEARSALNEVVPDLILLDIIMPHEWGEPEDPDGGAKILKWVKSEDRLKNVPVVVFSARGYDGPREDFLKWGAAAVIDKPAVPKEIAAAVAAQLAETKPQ